MRKGEPGNLYASWRQCCFLAAADRRMEQNGWRKNEWRHNGRNRYKCKGTGKRAGGSLRGRRCPYQEIYDLVTESVTLISPVIMQDNFIENYYNIDPALLEEYVFSMSEEATSAETVVIYEMKDKADADTISAALQLVIEEKSGEMENYLPGQYDIVKKSAVKTEGSYVYLVISEQADAIEKIIEAQL